MSTTPLEKAERDLHSLEEQREALFLRAKLLSKERDQIAFAALTAGDRKAKARLSEINAEDASLAANIASVEAALTVGRANLANAHTAEASAADRANALQIQELNAKLKEALDDADDAFADAIGSVLAARTLLQDMHALGVSSPTDQMFRINSVACIKTVIQMLPGPYISDFEFMRLSPSQKKSFKSLADAWGLTISNQIAARLPQKEDAA
jgi:hypothetical protein